MARRNSTLNLGLAYSQTQSRLLSELPPELRTYVWELVLYITPHPNGTIHLFRRNIKAKAPRSVLSFLFVCRLIHNEAAGVFYNINNLFFRGLRFSDTIRSPLRLNGIRNLTIQTGWESEEITATCKEVGKYLPRVQSLRFEMSIGGRAPEEHQVTRLEGERYWLQKAVAKLPVSLRKLTIVLPRRHTNREPSLQKKAREVLNDVASKVPSGGKIELLVRGFYDRGLDWRKF